MSNSILSQVKARVDVSGACQAYGVPLDWRGNKWIGLCPFPDHQEKTASFTVFGDGNFKCFGCQRHGDAVDFVRLLFGLDFKAAVAKLAADFGISGTAGPIEKPKKTQAQKLRGMFFGVVDALLADQKYFKLRLRRAVDPALVLALGKAETLLDELLSGTAEEQAAALLEYWRWRGGRYWNGAGGGHAA